MEQMNSIKEQEKLIYALDELSKSSSEEERKKELDDIKTKVLVKMCYDEKNNHNNPNQSLENDN